MSGMQSVNDKMRQDLGLAPLSQLPKDIPTSIEGDETLGGDFLPCEPAVLAIKKVKSSLDGVVSLENNDIAHDYLHARNTTHTLLEATGNALAGALKVAMETEHPRAYGVFNELASTMRQLTQDLLGLQKSFKDIKRDDKTIEEAIAPVTTVQGDQTNITINGGAAGVLKILEDHEKEMRKNKPQIVVDVSDAEARPA